MYVSSPLGLTLSLSTRKKYLITFLIIHFNYLFISVNLYTTELMYCNLLYDVYFKG